MGDHPDAGPVAMTEPPSAEIKFNIMKERKICIAV